MDNKKASNIFIVYFATININNDNLSAIYTIPCCLQYTYEHFLEILKNIHDSEIFSIYKLICVSTCLEL